MYQIEFRVQMCWKKKNQNWHLFDIEYFIPNIWKFCGKISCFCFCVQFLMKICTNPLIPSGANFNYVFDIMSLGSGFKMCVNGKKK